MTRREFWDRYLRVYDTLRMVKDFQEYQEGLARRLCERPGLRILDAGSGTGNLSIRMRQLGAMVVALDFSEVALAIHRQKDPSAEQVLASLEQPLPFPDDSFDGVASASVLFALPDAAVRIALGEFRRVLRPGGRLLVTAKRRSASVVKFCVNYLALRRRDGSLAPLLREVMSSAVPVVKLLYYTFRVRVLRHQQGYRRFIGGELLSAVRDAGFEQTRLGLTYLGNFLMVEGTAPN